MAVDILSTFPGWSTRFEIGWRKEQSETQSGIRLSKDMGPPLWQASYESVELSPNRLDYWRARLDELQGGGVAFEGYSKSRCYPIAYPNGSWPSGASFNGETSAVLSVGSDNASIALEALPSGFVLSIGDMIQIKRGSTDRRDLHRVMERAVADADGETAEFKIAPALWPSVTQGDLVSVKRPWCNMLIVPGTLSSQASMVNGKGRITFEAVETR